MSFLRITHAVLWAFSLTLSASFSQTSGEEFKSIDFPGAAGTSAWGINRHGDIAGIYYDSGFQAHGFVLRKGTFTPINAPGSTQTFVYGINDHDDLVGAYNDASGSIHGFLLHKDGDQDNTGDQGTFTIIDAPKASGFTTANGINRKGDIVGFYFDKQGIGHGFLLKRSEFSGDEANGLGTFIPIDVPGAISTYPTGINGEGDIVGSYRTSFTNPFLSPGFLLEDRKLTFINVPGTTYTAPNGINAEGDIVGIFLDTSTNQYVSFLLDDGRFTYPLRKGTQALGINGRGDIVGEYFPGPHGFLVRRERDHRDAEELGKVQ